MSVLHIHPRTMDEVVGYKRNNTHVCCKMAGNCIGTVGIFAVHEGDLIAQSHHINNILMY